MVYTVLHKASSFAGYCVYLFKNSIHLKRRDVFIFMQFKTTLVKFQICSFIVINLIAYNIEINENKLSVKNNEDINF